MKSEIANRASTQATQGRILSLLADLPPEGLTIAERFVRFLHDYAHWDKSTIAAQRADHPAYLYPTIGVPSSSLDAWLDLIPGYEGNALADTEALYDVGEEVADEGRR